MEPGAADHRGLVELVVGEPLAVPLLDHGEPAELTLQAVVVAVVVGVARDEPVAGDVVGALHTVDDVHRERQLGGPGPARVSVGGVEGGRRGVGDRRLCAQVVDHPGHQVGLAGQEPQVAQGCRRISRKRRRPHQAAGAVAEQVDHGDVGRLVADVREADRLRLAPPVPRLVEVKPDAVGAQVDEVGGARAVDVREAHPTLVELVGGVEPRSVVHGHLGSEAAVSDVRPVGHLAVADPHDVAETVAAHVRQVDRVGAVAEQEPRTLLLVGRLRCPPGLAEAVRPERGVPEQDVVLADQQVRKAPSGEVDEAHVPVDRGAVRCRVEGAPRQPLAVVGPDDPARQRAVEFDDLDAAVPVHVDELPPGARHHGLRRAADLLERSEARDGHDARGAGQARAQVALVVPSVLTLVEDPGHPLAVEVHPPAVQRVEPRREVVESGDSTSRTSGSARARCTRTPAVAATSPRR